MQCNTLVIVYYYTDVVWPCLLTDLVWILVYYLLHDVVYQPRPNVAFYRNVVPMTVREYNPLLPGCQVSVEFIMGIFNVFFFFNNLEHS